MKYHVNIKTGRSGICRATKTGCPLGEGTPHFENEVGAKKFIEEMAKSENNVFTKMSKTKMSKNNSSTVANSTPVVAKRSPYRYSEIMGATPENRVTDDVVEDFSKFAQNFNTDSKGSEGKESLHIRRNAQEIFSLNGVNKDSIKQLEDRVKKFKNDSINDRNPNDTKEIRDTINSKINATDKALSEINNLKSNIKDSNKDLNKFSDSTLHSIETFKGEIAELANSHDKLQMLPDGGERITAKINDIYGSNMRYGIDRGAMNNFINDLEYESSRLLEKADDDYYDGDMQGSINSEYEQEFLSDVMERFRGFLND